MLETIKTILLNTSGNTLAAYYQSRLQATNSAVEVDAILSMNTLMTFNEQEELQDEGSK